ncbi:SDR family oxidoreductase [Candidatus Babeliales bacterium]|nr:SDR family oxidoreductase [Candidatus Babeliales bacterium]
MVNVKNILVTGGAGFLGSHLCKVLLEKNYKVLALDNLYTGRFVNIEPLIKNENFHFIKHDIIKPINLDVDWIFNLACPASPPHYQKDPIYTTKTSIIGSMNLLELAKKNKSRILHASTSEVYGDPLQHPQKENYRGNVNSIGIRSCYDEGKRCAESLFFDYNRMYDIDIRVVRIFNTYGPNMDPQDGRVVSNFIIQALRNEPLTVYGDGSQTRSFCYVSDLIDGIVKMMELEDKFCGPVNLGNPQEYTILDLANFILKSTSSNSNIIFEKLPADDPTKRCPDISLAKEKLGWEPKIGLKKGLKDTISYFKRLLNNENCCCSRGQIPRSSFGPST